MYDDGETLLTSDVRIKAKSHALCIVAGGTYLVYIYTESVTNIYHIWFMFRLVYNVFIYIYTTHTRETIWYLENGDGLIFVEAAAAAPVSHASL